MPTPLSLPWPRVNALRLAQHALAPRLPRAGLVEAAARTLGIQAQLMPAAELALGARVDGLAPQDVQAALWQERSLVKTWTMRGTLHLLPAADLPLYAAARGVYESRNWPYYFEYYGIPRPQYQAFLAAVPEVLGAEPMTREQLAGALARHTGLPAIKELILSKSWGSPLKPPAWRGELCFGPNQGRSVTFVNPRQWLGGWQPREPYPALQEILRRYLRACGPSTPEDFARWWDGSAGLTQARKLFRSIEGELERVEVEGWQAYALRAALEPASDLPAAGVVRLLPLFDAYVLGLSRGPELEPLLPRPYQALVYRPQGWISATVIVDGYLRGVWEHKPARRQTALTVRMFEPPSDWVRQGIEAEAGRLGDFWNTKVVLEFEVD